MPFPQEAVREEARFGKLELERDFKPVEGTMVVQVLVLGLDDGNVFGNISRQESRESQALEVHVIWTTFQGSTLTTLAYSTGKGLHHRTSCFIIQSFLEGSALMVESLNIFTRSK